MNAKRIERSQKTWVLLAISAAACGSQPPAADVPNPRGVALPEQASFGSIVVSVRLSARFDPTTISGLRLSIDGESLPLQLTPSPPTRFTSSGRSFDIETRDMNGDGKNDFVVSFAQSPFGSQKEFEFIFNGKWNQAVHFRIDCTIPAGANGVDTGSARSTVEGQPIYFVADQTRRVNCDVDCRPGVTCNR